MKVLFKKLVINVGHPGDIKEVKTGYAMNCLLPQGLAIEVTPAIDKRLKEQSKSKDKQQRNLIANKHEILEKINGAKISFTLKAGKNGKVFGGIGEKDIIAKIKKIFNIDITKKHIELPNGHIKNIGESFIFINLGKDSMAKIIVDIQNES